MNKIIILLVMLILVGCDAIKIQTEEYELTDSARKAFQQWILIGMKNANPKSDEEPEDMIQQLEDTGFKLFGTKVRYYEYWEGGSCIGKIKVSEWTIEKENALLNND